MLETYAAALLAFALTLIITPRWMSIARGRGLVGRDMNKHARPEVAEAGGIAVFAGFLAGMAVILASLALRGEALLTTLASLASVSIITAIAYADDVSGWKKGFVRWKKPLITAVAVIPLIPFLLGRDIITVLGTTIELPFLFYPLVMVPVGFIVATNAVNLLGGFNGLEASLAVVGLSTLAWFAQGTAFLPMLVVAIAGLLAFLWFNRFPSRVFPGDTLTYMVGALFAVVAVMGSFQTVTVLIMAPYILEGAIKSREIHYIYRNKRIFRPECFGIPDREDRLKPPYPQVWSLTHVAMRLVNRVRPCRENDVTLLLAGAYALWCLGLVLVFG